MIDFIFIFLLFNGIYINGEIPRIGCRDDKPFKTSYKSCADFKDICVKSDDIDCKNFQSACSQCPPSNYSILMYMDMLNMKNELMISKGQIRNLTDKIERNVNETAEISAKFNQNRREIFIILGISIITIVISIILSIIEVKFNIITKRIGRNKRTYSAVNNKQKDFTDGSVKLEELSVYFRRNEKFLEGKFDDIIGHIKHIIDFPLKNIEFQMTEQDKPIKIWISDTDNVVKVKKEICTKASIKNLKYYKIMKLKYKEKFLDDNKSLLSQMDFKSVIIKCEIDVKKDPKDIIALQIRHYNDSPKLYQFLKSQTVHDVKSILPENVSETIVIYKKKILRDVEMLTNYNLQDDSLLTLMNNHKKLTIDSIFEKKQTVTVDYNISDLINAMLTNISNQFNTDIKNLFLFLENQYLDENKYLYEYVTDRNPKIQICFIKKFVNVKLFEPIYNDFFYEFCNAADKDGNILIKKYKIPIGKDNTKFILKELATFQITKCHSRFVQIDNIYNHNDYIHVAIENMEKGIMSEYLNKNSPVTLSLIRRWLDQILEGLLFLHENDTIFRVFNPASIFINNCCDIKLFNLNFSKYTECYKPSSSLNKNREFLPIRYIAPEILKGRDYDASADVWSFGAIIFKMASGKELFSNLSTNEIIEKISQLPEDYYNIKDDNYIKDELFELNINSQLKELIYSCMKLNPSDRTSVYQLKNHDFIKREIENEK